MLAVIASERQYQVTRSKARMFAHAIETFDPKSDDFADVHPRLVQAQLEAMESVLTDLRKELEECVRHMSA